MTKKHKWTLDEFIDSFRDHIGSILDKATITDLIDLGTFGALAYMSQAVVESKEYKLFHVGMTGLAYRQLTKDNSSEAQSLHALGWIVGEMANYLIWVEIQRLKARNEAYEEKARAMRASLQGKTTLEQISIIDLWYAYPY